jgi:hypothetical protein
LGVSRHTHCTFAKTAAGLMRGNIPKGLAKCQAGLVNGFCIGLNSRGVLIVSSLMKPWRSFWCGALIFISAGAIVFSAENEAIILDDQFTDGNKDRTGPLDLNWRYVQNIKFDLVEDAKPGELVVPRYLRVRPLGNYPTFVAVFDLNPGSREGGGSGLTLGNKKGDLLELLVEFRFTEPATKDTEMRIGLFNNGGTPSQEHTMTPYQDDPGYYVSIPQAGGKGDALKELGTMGSIAGGSDKVFLRAAQGALLPPLKDEWHTISMVLTRHEQGILVVGKLDGVVFATGIDSPAPQDKQDPPGLYNVFHELGFTTGAPNTNSVMIRRVQLRGNPKEPAEVVTKLSEPAPAEPAGGSAAKAGLPAWVSMVLGACGLITGISLTLLFTRKKGS